MASAISHLTAELRLRQCLEATADLARAETALLELLKETRTLHGAERARNRRYVSGYIVATRIALGRFRSAWSSERATLRAANVVSLPPSAADMEAAAAAELALRSAA